MGNYLDGPHQSKLGFIPEPDRCRKRGWRLGSGRTERGGLRRPRLGAEVEVEQRALRHLRFRRLRGHTQRVHGARRQGYSQTRGQWSWTRTKF